MYHRPPIWESSSRPLYPKCVWIEGGGYRHFILDHDFNKKRRWSHQNKLITNSLNRFTFDMIQESVDNLTLVGCGENVTTERPSHGKRIYAEKCLKSNTAPSRSTKKSSKSKDGKKHKDSMVKEDLSEITETQGLVENTDLDVSKNQLTERVLQWLDLAGRHTLVRSENERSKQTTIPRRIFTTDSIKKPKSTPLKRSESVHHLSLTFNEDESLQVDRQNPQFGKGTLLHRCASKIADRKPMVQAIKRSLLAEGLMGKFDNIDIHSGGEPKTYAAVDGNNTKNQRRKNEVDSIENQYRLMISRQILENSCNTQLAKRQLHIFMPKLPKKQMANSGGETDSCFSSILSKMP